jgi:hypothetical protein
MSMSCWIGMRILRTRLRDKTRSETGTMAVAVGVNWPPSALASCVLTTTAGPARQHDRHRELACSELDVKSIAGGLDRVGSDAVWLLGDPGDHVRCDDEVIDALQLFLPDRRRRQRGDLP